MDNVFFILEDSLFYSEVTEPYSTYCSAQYYSKYMWQMGFKTVPNRHLLLAENKNACSSFIKRYYGPFIFKLSL